MDCDIDNISFDGAIDSSDMNMAHGSTSATIIKDNYELLTVLVVLHGSDT